MEGGRECARVSSGASGACPTIGPWTLFPPSVRGQSHSLANITGIIMRVCGLVDASAQGQQVRTQAVGSFQRALEHQDTPHELNTTWPQPIFTCAQNVVLALPSMRFMARSRPPVWVTPSATR